MKEKLKLLNQLLRKTKEHRNNLGFHKAEIIDDVLIFYKRKTYQGSVYYDKREMPAEKIDSQIVKYSNRLKELESVQ